MSSQDNFVVGPYADPDKYRLRRQVGSGGEAELWQATVSVDGADETVAVKILRAEHAIDPEQWQARWSDQVEMLRLLRHPGVVGVHEFFAGPGLHLPGEADAATQRHYLVMNWVEGTDVREWVATTHDQFEAVRHLTQLAEVLDWLHSGGATSSRRPVVHGDISPGNVIINPDGQTVLVDFGLFRMAQDSRTSRLGTDGYCAPEVAQGEYSPASDRYAFGALALFMLTGQTPPSDDHALREALLTHLRPLFDGADAETIVSIAIPEAAERPTAGEWLRALRPHATTAAPREKPLPPPHPSTNPSRGRTLLSRFQNRKHLAAAGSGLLVLLLVVLYLGWKPAEVDTPTGDVEPTLGETDLLTMTPNSSRGFVAPQDTDAPEPTEPHNGESSTAEETLSGTPQESPPLAAPCDDKPFATYDVTSFGSLNTSVSASDNSEDVEVTITAQGSSNAEDATLTPEAGPEDGTTKDTTVLNIGQDDDIGATVNLDNAHEVRIEFEGGDSGTCAIDSGWFQTQ